MIIFIELTAQEVKTPDEHSMESNSMNQRSEEGEESRRIIVLIILYVLRVVGRR